MVAKFLDPRLRLGRALEYDIWRSCNMIGVRGADPFGLAVPFADRGHEVRVVTERVQTFPFRRFRRFFSREEAELARFAIQDNHERARRRGVSIRFRAPRFEDIADGLRDGWIPLPLVHMGVVHRLDIPHWNVVTGIQEPVDGRSVDTIVEFHDPYPPKGRARLRMPRARFEKMMKDIRDRMDSSRSLVLVRARQRGDRVRRPRAPG